MKKEIFVVNGLTYDSEQERWEVGNPTSILISDHQKVKVKYDYAISGEGFLEPEEVKITLPKTIFKDNCYSWLLCKFLFM